jgi:phosphoribosylaminoimidazole-succinocarboxamide synthase
VNKWIGFPSLLDEYKDQLEGRSMIVRKCEVIKVEAIVRGYITGACVVVEWDGMGVGCDEIERSNNLDSKKLGLRFLRLRS